MQPHIAPFDVVLSEYDIVQPVVILLRVYISTSGIVTLFLSADLFLAFQYYF